MGIFPFSQWPGFCLGVCLGVCVISAYALPLPRPRSHAPTAASPGKDGVRGLFQAGLHLGLLLHSPPSACPNRAGRKTHAHTGAHHRGPAHRKSFIRQKRSINGPDGGGGRETKSTEDILTFNPRTPTTKQHTMPCTASLGAMITGSVCVVPHT